MSGSNWVELLETLKKIAVMDGERELLALAEKLYIEDNEVASTKCYQRAAMLGFASGQYQLGQAYEVGIGVAPNEEAAVHWYTRAAMQRHADAMSVLANYYYDGLIVEKNDEIAKALLLLSTESEYTAEKLQDWFFIDTDDIDDTMKQQAEQRLQTVLEPTTESFT